MKLDSKRITDFAVSYIEEQKNGGQVSDFFEQIQPDLDSLDMDNESKTAFIKILFHSINLNAQISASITAEIIERVYNQKDSMNQQL